MSILILVGTLFFSSLAFAETSQVECFKKGTMVSNLEQADAATLCNSASSTAPVDCFRMVTTLTLISTNQAKYLCTNATSDLPARCYREAMISSPNVTSEQAVELCRTRPEVRGYFTPIQ